MLSLASKAATRIVSRKTRPAIRLDGNWLYLAPFLLFIVAFEVLPLLGLLKSALVVDGRISLGTLARAMRPSMMEAFANSLWLSLLVAAIGTVAGAILACVIVTSRSGRLRHALTALADVSANFGGAPLAFAFIITLGSTGVLTLLLKQAGIALYPGFRIYSMEGLVMAYLYFEIPLAVLLLIPCFQGLRREWQEAAAVLGADERQYWQYIALPILRPGLLSGFLLLFANAFGAYATAWTLTGSSVNLVTVQIAALIRGEVQLDPALADAIAALSLVIMMVSVALHQILVSSGRRRA